MATQRTKTSSLRMKKKMMKTKTTKTTMMLKTTMTREKELCPIQHSSRLIQRGAFFPYSVVLAEFFVAFAAAAAAAAVEDGLVDGFVVDDAMVKIASLIDLSQGTHVQK